MRSAVAFSFAALVACGSSNTAVGAPPAPSTIRITGAGGGALTVAAGAEANFTLVPYAMDAVWRVLPAAFDSVGLAVAQLDAATRTVDNGGVKLRRQLGSVPLSRYIDCGNTQIGASADSYEILLTVRTQARPEGSSATSIGTIVDAVGKPITFAQDYSRCTSTGKLEERLAEVIRAKLAR